MRKFVYLLLMLTSSLSAISEMVEIENETAAGNYSEALSLLEKYRNQQLKPWQRDRLFYNMGTVLLKEGKYDEAMNYFRMVTSTSDTFLRPRVLINSAVALWRDVNSSLPMNKYSAYSRSIDKLNTAIYYLKQVDEKEFPQAGELNESIKSVLASLKRDVKASNQDFKDSKSQQLTFLRMMFNSEKAAELLLSLQSRYLFVLEQDLVPVDSIEKMIVEQDLIESLYPEMGQSTRYLKKAMNALNDQKPLKGKLFLKAAYENALWITGKKEVADPAAILRELIRRQTYSIDVASMVQVINDESLKSIALEAQQHVNNTAKSFLPKVYDHQVALYHKPVKEKDLRCQCRPWDEVLPLFDQGLDFAKASEDELNQKRVDYSLLFQKKSLQYWEKALEALEKQQDSDNAEEEKKETRETLRLLQQMEQDDSQPPKKSQAVEGNRPW